MADETTYPSVDGWGSRESTPEAPREQLVSTAVLTVPLGPRESSEASPEEVTVGGTSHTWQGSGQGQGQGRRGLEPGSDRSDQHPCPSPGVKSRLPAQEAKRCSGRPSAEVNPDRVSVLEHVQGTHSAFSLGHVSLVTKANKLFFLNFPRKCRRPHLHRNAYLRSKRKGKL